MSQQTFERVVLSGCLPFSCSLSVEFGVFGDGDGDTLGDAGETMTYTTTVENTGNVRVGGVKISHLLGEDAALVCDTDFEAATSSDVRRQMLGWVQGWAAAAVVAVAKVC